MVSIASASIIGSLVPQQHGEGFYLGRYGRTWGKVMVTFGIDELYRAPWFLALLGALAANIVACAIHRFRLRTLPLVSVVTHSSLLLILAGGFVDLVWGLDGYVQIARGDSTEEYVDGGERPRRLGFGIELVDFRLEYESDREKVLLFKTDHSPAVQEVTLDARVEYVLDGEYRIRIVKDVPEFASATFVPEEVRKIKALHGPALLVEVVFPDGHQDRRWIFGANPSVDINPHADRSVRVLYLLRSIPRDFVSSLAIHDGISTVQGEVRSNAPFSYKGYDFTQCAYDDRAQAWSALRVTHEPGTPLVLIGLVLLMAGASTRVTISLDRSRRIRHV